MTDSDRPGRPLSIVIVTWHFPPSSEVAGKTDWRLARALAVRGVRVRVITAPISEAPALDEGYGKPIPTGLQVVRVRPWWDPVRTAIEWRNRRRRRVAPGATRGVSAAASGAEAVGSTGRLRRIVQTLQFPDRANLWIVPASRALRRLLREEPTDLVISVSPLVSVHLVARLSGLPTSGTRWYAWLHDPITDNPFNSHSRRSAAILARIEATIFRRATRVLVTTPALSKLLTGRHGVSAPAVLPCSFAAEEMPVIPPPSAQGRTRLELAHVGTLYGHRSPIPILESLARLRGSGRIANEAIRIRFVGSFEIPGESLEEMIGRLGLTHMATAEPPVSQALALQVLAEADCGVLLAEGQPLQIPAKAYEYIGMRKPIFAVADGATAELVVDWGIGIACKRGDLDAALLMLLESWRSGGFSDYAEALESASAQYEAGPVAERLINSLNGDAPR